MARPKIAGRTPNRPKIWPTYGPLVKFNINQNNVFKVVSAQQYMTEVIIEHIFIVGLLVKYASTISIVVSTISTVVTNVSH